MESDAYVFVAYTQLDLYYALSSIADLPRGTPVRILFRGAVLDYPRGASSRAMEKLVDFANHLVDTGPGVH